MLYKLGIFVYKLIAYKLNRYISYMKYFPIPTLFVLISINLYIQCEKTHENE